MNLCTLTAAFGLGFSLFGSAMAAQMPAAFPLRYRWAPGQTLRYVLQSDPYFADPSKALETADPNAPYRPPTVQRLTEQVLSVGKDGTATLRLTLASEPGFEDGTPPETQTVTVTPQGQVSGAEGASAPQLLSAIFRLPDAPVSMRGGLAIIMQEGTPSVRENRSSGHDGTLLQTTRSLRSDRVVFDTSAGSLLRRTGTITGSLSLVMIRPAGRSAADFGRVVPNLPIWQTLTIERKEDSLPGRVLPSHASTARQSKN